MNIYIVYGQIGTVWLHFFNVKRSRECGHDFIGKIKKYVKLFFSSFKNQIIMVSIVTIVAVILLAVFLFYSSTISMIKKDSVDSNKITLNQINGNFADHAKTCRIML